MTNMARAWASAEGADLLGPYDLVEGENEKICTRKMMLVPHAYVAQVLFRSLSREEAWLEVGEKILQDQRGEDCLPVLNFLRVASCCFVNFLVSAFVNRDVH
jgi:hypothetical protein